jgi:glycerophosphoryl diester phosphodiesterase
VSVIGAWPADVMVWSFRPETVERVRLLAPAVPCALLSPPLSGPHENLFTVALQRHQQAISLHHTSVDDALVRAAALRGLTTFTWTADDPADHLRLASAGVAGIVTNVPDILQSSLRAWSWPP